MSFIKTRKKLVSSAIASSLSIVAVPAIANPQTDLPTIQTNASETQSLKVDQSANAKYVAELLDTPKSVVIIPQKLIQETNVTTLSDALRSVPGITLGAGEGGNPNGDRPFIRGYNSESSISVDGIRNAASQNREMFAVDQIEITKGSASVLTGGGSAGGTINMITKVAKKGSFLEGSVQGGTDDYARVTLDGNKDFGNGIAARVAILGHQNDKAGQSNGAEYKRAGIAPSITFGLDTPTRATLSYYYLKTDDMPDAGIPYWNSANKTATGKPLDVKQGTYYGWKARDFQKQENQSAFIKLEHDLTPDITVSNMAVYNKSKNDYVWTQPDDSQQNIAAGKVWRRANTRITDIDNFSDQLSLAGKLNTGIIQHSFNVGAEYSHQKADVGSYVVTNSKGQTGGGFSGNGACKNQTLVGSQYWCTSAYNPNPNDPWLGRITANPNISTTTTSTTSLYALDQIELMPQWLLDLGVRWDKFDTEQEYHQDVSGRTPVKAGTKFENNTNFFSYQAGITYKPTENGSIYLSYATSANPVGVNAGDGDGGDGGLATNTQDLDPEKSRTYELGTKWELLNDKLMATASVFRTEKQNARVAVNATTTANAGESRVDGVELGLNGNITKDWDIFAGYTYLNSKLIKAAYNATATEGNKLTNVPKNSASIWTTYKILPQWLIGAGAVASDKVYGNLENTKWVSGYVRYDAMVRYDVNKNIDLQLNLNNLSDKRYFTKAYASHYAVEAEGRSAVLALNFRY